MKNLFLFLVYTVIISPIYSQSNNSFGRIDTVSKGDCDDFNPILVHGTPDFST